MLDADVKPGIVFTYLIKNYVAGSSLLAPGDVKSIQYTFYSNEP